MSTHTTIVTTKARILRLTTTAMLAALSIVLIFLVQIPIFPSAPFLKYDMADVPILVGGLLLGPLPGMVILLIVSLFQAFLMGGDSWIGALMHFCASGALVLVASLFYRWRPTLPMLGVGLCLGSLAMTALMIPLNLIFTVKYMGQPLEVVQAMIWPITVPFNLIKSFGNSAITFLVMLAAAKPLQKILGTIRPHPLYIKAEK